MSLPGEELRFDDELSQASENEANLALLGFECTDTLLRDDFLSVIRGSLDTLMRTAYSHSEEERALFSQVHESLAEATPRLGVRAGLAYEDSDQIGEQRRATGEIEFVYSIKLDSPWDLEDAPIRYQRGLGDKIVLDGMGFEIAVGRVFVDQDRNKRFEEEREDKDYFYTVAGPKGEEVVHPEPAKLFPQFAEDQMAELADMALCTTDAYVQAYGMEADVLWDKTSGTLWDVKAPGTRDMWRDAANIYDVN